MPDAPDPTLPAAPPASANTDPPADPPAPADPPLGPEGERALQAWKDRAKAAEAAARKLPQIEAELAEIRTAQMSEQERAIEEARREAADAARTEALAGVNARLFAAELRAAAAAELTIDGKPTRLADPSLLADPEVALRLLGLDEVPVTESGDIDAAAISASLASLVESKPYLAASATRPAGNADQGARHPLPPAKDLDTQIQEAEAAGDWPTVGRLKLHKLAAAAPRP